MFEFHGRATESFKNIGFVTEPMRGAFIGILLVIGLLVFGCAGQQSAQGNVSANTSGGNMQGGSAGAGNAGGNAMENTTQPSGGSAGGENMTANETGGSMGGGSAAGNVSGASGGSTTGGTGSAAAGSNLGGLDYAGLLAAGVPVQCDVTTNESTVHLFMNGNGVVRMEAPSTSPDDTCQQTVMIMQGNKIDYMCAQGTMMGSDMFAGCDWIEMTFNMTAAAQGGQSGSGSGASDASSVQSAPAAQFSCSPWVPDASKFQVTGKVCNLQDIMNQAMGNYSAGAGGSYNYGG
jgi:hypothetical protein